MEIKTEITREDFLNVNKHVFFKNRLKKYLIIFSVSNIVLMMMIYHRNPSDLAGLVIAFVVFNALCGLWGWVVWKVTNSRIKKMPSENGGVLGSKTYILQDDGFKSISDSSESLTKWNGIQKIEISKNYIYIFIDNIAAYIVPIRAFRDTSEMEQFVEIIKSHL